MMAFKELNEQLFALYKILILEPGGIDRRKEDDDSSGSPVRWRTLESFTIRANRLP
jgi:hypothetical protein